MAKKIRTSAPTQEELDQAFGMPMPAAFLRFLTVLLERAEGSRERLDEESWGLFGFEFSGPVEPVIVPGLRRWASPCYRQTPPELVPIGRTGVDGDHYGYIVHAPELGLEDYPIGNFCPMDSDGVVIAGVDTREALSSQLALSIEMAEDPESGMEIDEDAAEAVSAALGLEPDAAARGDERDQVDLGAWDQFVPDGWHWVRSADMVGTLAPMEAFGGAPVDYRGHEATKCKGAAVSHAVELAREELWRARPANALALLREVYWERCGEPGIGAAVSPVMAEVYEGLGRGVLARAVVERVGRI
jgi:hypothetical protein